MKYFNYEIQFDNIWIKNNSANLNLDNKLKTNYLFNLTKLVLSKLIKLVNLKLDLTFDNI